jgi:hypothetical protein
MTSATETIQKIIKDESSDIEDEDDDFDDDNDDMDAPEFNEDFDIGSMLSNFFVTEDGTNVAEALSGIKKSIDTHNKLMMKILAKEKMI